MSPSLHHRCCHINISVCTGESAFCWFNMHSSNEAQIDKIWTALHFSAICWFCSFFSTYILPFYVLLLCLGLFGFIFIRWNSFVHFVHWVYSVCAHELMMMSTNIRCRFMTFVSSWDHWNCHHTTKSTQLFISYFSTHMHQQCKQRITSKRIVFAIASRMTKKSIG